jgi:hypothetical protein
LNEYWTLGNSHKEAKKGENATMNTPSPLVSSLASVRLLLWSERSAISTPGLLFLVLILTACGGSGGADTSSPVGGTLAYVETECRGSVTEGFVEHQALRIRQGDREPVTVFETPEVSAPGQGDVCQLYDQFRLGNFSISREAFQAVSVSPDGASVVFEVSDDFSSKPPLPLNLPPEQKGIFWVGADGKGLRRLGPPSRERFFNSVPTVPFAIVPLLGLSFSPNGRAITFVDRGPDADGHEADQVVTVDVATGTRQQVTRLPPAVPPPEFPPDAPTVQNPRFIDDRTIAFLTSANPGELNPQGAFVLMTIKTDGSALEVSLPILIPLPGSTVELRFVITGDRPEAIGVAVPGPTPINPDVGSQIQEVFVVDQQKNILQLTNFGRSDTGGALVDVDREHVYFQASADPLGTNPTENCQLFSIDRVGSDLRQLTKFREVEHSMSGCRFPPLSYGCGLEISFQDPRSRTLVFYSSCDPLGRNLNGGQIFAVQPDGSGLRQLTDARGLVEEVGAFSGDLPGPWAYGPSVASSAAPAPP